MLWSSSKMASTYLEDTPMFHGVNITFLKLKKQPCSYFDLDLFALLSLLTVSVIVIAFSYCFLFFSFISILLWKSYHYPLTEARTFMKLKNNPLPSQYWAFLWGSTFPLPTLTTSLFYERFSSMSIFTPLIVQQAKWKRTTSPICLNINVL